jgi:hypothetical protein
MIPLRHVVALALVALFLALAALHVAWAFGGRWGASVAVPEVDGRPAFRPSRAATLVVALLLGAAAAIIAMRASTDPGPSDASWLPRLVRIGTWTLSAVFALRAVGNFDTFGFFKVARDTPFARYDTLLFSPLCAAIALGCIVVARGP